MATNRIRIASFNVENLFARARVLGAPPGVADPVLDAYARVNEIFEHEIYSPADKAEILRLLKVLDLLLDDGDATREDTFAVMRRIRGKLLKKPQGGTADDVIVVAEGRQDWVGWVELIKDRTDSAAMSNTARVFTEIGADIVGVVEAEDRNTLQRFGFTLIRDEQGEPRYPHVMLIDGNDKRGIDVGVISTGRYPLRDIRSHVDDGPLDNRTFSRDCPEYRFQFPAGSALAGQPFVLLVNHLKSKFGGHQSSSDKRRKKQAARVAEIYRRLRDEGVEHVVVLGDFNDTPDSDALKPLLDATDLTDISAAPGFDDGGRPGTLGNGTARQKIDYILLSPSLFARASGGAIFRKGVWGGVHGTLFPHFDTIAGPEQAASDHAAVYADLDIG
ncbi:endonuclease/exonuclease/phosphatase family protein [Nocardia yamanashiensis]|uniref:endonuclease/exonuclease/phosphatase family protein n=1 Tax=Nocardia yamanashiensis TaxID=209247 RepID=UPI001E56E0E5|nr:endonuclease/exonuclease/phosphatase family protein [Nocardia yamanashiensis]UGT42841.1 endonuclease/exonuclease/phosphatase family protein [Nocardia yamanashiensis]